MKDYMVYCRKSKCEQSNAGMLTNITVRDPRIMQNLLLALNIMLSA